MRLFLTAFLILLGTLVYSSDNLIDEEIPHYLYISSLIECEDCLSYTIIISDVEVDKTISKTFKNIAESFGKKHAGAIVTWSNALTNYRFFKNHRCNTFTNLGNKVIIYIDKNKQYCINFPYDDQTNLSAMIKIIGSNVGKFDDSKDKTWRLKAQNEIYIYAKENKIVDSSRQLTYEFIDYINDSLLEYNK